MSESLTSRARHVFHVKMLIYNWWPESGKSTIGTNTELFNIQDFPIKYSSYPSTLFHESSRTTKPEVSIGNVPVASGTDLSASLPEELIDKARDDEEKSSVRVKAWDMIHIDAKDMDVQIGFASPAGMDYFASSKKCKNKLNDEMDEIFKNKYLFEERFEKIKIDEREVEVLKKQKILKVEKMEDGTQFFQTEIRWRTDDRKKTGIEDVDIYLKKLELPYFVVPAWAISGGAYKTEGLKEKFYEFNKKLGLEPFAFVVTFNDLSHIADSLVKGKGITDSQEIRDLVKNPKVYDISRDKPVYHLTERPEQWSYEEICREVEKIIKRETNSEYYKQQQERNIRTATLNAMQLGEAKAKDYRTEFTQKLIQKAKRNARYEKAKEYYAIRKHWLMRNVPNIQEHLLQDGLYKGLEVFALAAGWAKEEADKLFVDVEKTKLGGDVTGSHYEKHEVKLYYTEEVEINDRTYHLFYKLDANFSEKDDKVVFQLDIKIPKDRKVKLDKVLDSELKEVKLGNGHPYNTEATLPPVYKKIGLNLHDGSRLIRVASMTPIVGSYIDLNLIQRLTLDYSKL